MQQRRGMLRNRPAASGWPDASALTSPCLPLPSPPTPPLQFNTACPGLFGSPAEFRKNYEHPVLAGRDAGATDAQLEKAGGGAGKAGRGLGGEEAARGGVGQRRAGQGCLARPSCPPDRPPLPRPCSPQGAAAQQVLVARAQQYMIRRTSETLKQYLPAKVQQVQGGQGGGKRGARSTREGRRGRRMGTKPPGLMPPETLCFCLPSHLLCSCSARSSSARCRPCSTPCTRASWPASPCRVRGAGAGAAAPALQRHCSAAAEAPPHPSPVLPAHPTHHAAALEGRKLERDRALATLPAINALKKLCCHPDMVGRWCCGVGAGSAVAACLPASASALPRFPMPADPRRSGRCSAARAAAAAAACCSRRHATVGGQPQPKRAARARRRAAARRGWW